MAERWDIDDYLEEVKFQLTEFNEMTEEIILDWEQKARQWVNNHIDGKHIISKFSDEILITVKDEDIMAEIALDYHRAFRDNTVDTYWKKFKI